MMNVNCLLLVDDNQAEIAAMTFRLQHSTIAISKLVIATSLIQAVESIKSDSPDVVILDLDLNDSKSLETLKAVRSMTDNVVIVISDTEDERLGVDCIRQGADDFIVKGDLCDSCLKLSIVNCITRRSVYRTTSRIQQKVDELCSLAGV